MPFQSPVFLFTQWVKTQPDEQFLNISKKGQEVVILVEK